MTQKHTEVFQNVAESEDANLKKVKGDEEANKSKLIYVKYFWSLFTHISPTSFHLKWNLRMVFDRPVCKHMLFFKWHSSLSKTCIVM